MRLSLAGVSAGYAGRAVLHAVSLEIGPGELVGLVGPNGAGKSTLLRVAAGVLAPSAGRVALEGVELRSMSRRAVATKVAWLPQAQGTDLAFSAREIVAMGRLPHLGAIEPPRERDRVAIERAIAAAGIGALVDRPFPDLSEGEKQRVFLARCLAQEASIALLDEPTASLDAKNAWSLLGVVRERSRDGAGVIAAIHDLALAARVCDRIVVLDGGRVIRDGAPLDALAPEVIAETFGMRARVERGEDGITLALLGPSQGRDG
jgi:iron complex transport system ATP-binding protein